MKKKKKHKTIDPVDDFEDKLTIDEYRLDTLSAEQPRLVWRYNRALGDAQSKVERLERKLKQTMVDLDDKVREDPEEYGIGKISEPAIKAAIERTPAIRDINEEILQARKAMRRRSADCIALEHRRTTLSHFIALRDQSYFSEPGRRLKRKD